MALDGSTENDFVYTDRGITFVIEKDLLEKIKPIRIDFTESDAGTGFSITANLRNTEGCC
jgi:iron-sulfur cluster assembly protein